MPMFDSSLACLPGLRFWLPGPVRWRISPGCRRGLSVLARAVSRRAFGSWTTPGLAAARAYAPASVAFPLQAHGRRPEFVFRSSIPRPSMPLSTLHPAPRGTQRKTRGQDGSLLLSCGALSSPTARRFIPTIALAHARGFHEKAGSCQEQIWSFQRYRSTPTNGRRDHPSNAFLLRKVFDRASDDADRRPAGGAANLRPSQNFPSPNRPASIRTLVGARGLRCQLGSSISNGCCHLSIELICIRCRLRSFRRALAVTRTRRFCVNQNP